MPVFAQIDHRESAVGQRHPSVSVDPSPVVVWATMDECGGHTVGVPSESVRCSAAARIEEPGDPTHDSAFVADGAGTLVLAGGPGVRRVLAESASEPVPNAVEDRGPFGRTGG